VAPAQDSFMCRLRIPNGLLKHWQLAGVADLAERYGGGYSHVTTRANIQIREILPKHSVPLIEGVQDIGLCSRGSGADNIRNVTGTPTAGIDPQELIDTRAYAREWHYHILNDRSLTGLPRKFNVAFDGAGRIAVLEDTNDIAFAAVEVKDGFGVAPGIWFRLSIGGITGHKDFARDTGIIVKAADATRVADAIVRVFIDTGDRTNRLKARMKYVIDAIGVERFMAAVEEKLGQKLVHVSAEAIAPRPAFDRMAHIGVHPQKQSGLNWIGVALPLGKLTGDQMRGLARIAQDLGDGDIRLTVWQNLLISGVADEKVALATAAIDALGLAVTASPIRAGLIACTGNAGCKFAASDTKRHAADIGDWCEPRVPIETPLNIHLTGCHHSCAQHYISDIGLLAAKVPVGTDDDTVEGYHLYAGGGFGPDADIGQEIYRDVKAEDAPKAVEKLLKAYVANRASADETFLAFSRRHDGETLRKMAEAEISA
jgi:ferredoxin-nitrite reductase